MRRASVFAAVVAVLFVGGCNGGSDQQPDTGVAGPGPTTAMEEAPVLETSGDTVRRATVRIAVVCAGNHTDVNIRGFVVRVPRGAEVQWHLVSGGTASVTIAPKDTAARSWGLSQPLPLALAAGDSVSGGQAQTDGTWRYNVRYQCQLGGSTHQGVIDPEVIIVPGSAFAVPDVP